MLEDSAILTAIENENACNPVLRTSARATIELVERYVYNNQPLSILCNVIFIYSQNSVRLSTLRENITTTG